MSTLLLWKELGHRGRTGRAARNGGYHVDSIFRAAIAARRSMLGLRNRNKVDGSGK